MDAINNQITSVKESATVKMEQLGRKCREIIEEVCGHLSSFGNLCCPILCLASKASNCTHTSWKENENCDWISKLVYISYNFHLDSTVLLLFIMSNELESLLSALPCWMSILSDDSCVAYCDSEWEITELLCVGCCSFTSMPIQLHVWLNLGQRIRPLKELDLSI